MTKGSPDNSLKLVFLILTNAFNILIKQVQEDYMTNGFGIS